MKRQDYVPCRPVVPAFYTLFCFWLFLFVACKSARAEVIEAWVQRDKSPSFRFASGNAVAFDKSGNVVIAGAYEAYSFSGGPGTNFYTAKHSQGNGTLLWEKTYGQRNFDDIPIAVATDDCGNVIVTGFSEVGFLVTDIYTVKYASSNGAILWERRYNGSANASDAPAGLAIDSSGNVIVTGFSTGTNFIDLNNQRAKYDLYTAKYAAADGSLLWERRYNGPGDGMDEAKGIALDSADNVFVTGTSRGSSSSQDFYTAKYSAADGALLWEKHYNSLNNIQESAAALAIDSHGNVVVTGMSIKDAIDADWVTVKYAAEDGAIIWRSTYSGPTSEIDSPSAVVIDSNDDVIVTGLTQSGTYTDYYTAKYAAEDGQLKWYVRYGGPANLADYPLAVAVDAKDNAIVAGISAHAAGLFDYYTAKYGSESGALMWEKRYNGPTGKDDRIVGKNSLAIGPVGQVAVTGYSNYGNFSSDYTWATILYREVLPSISVEMISSGVRLSFTGTAGDPYQVERAPSVSGPWEVIASPVASAGGVVEYIDTNRPAGMAFYRTRTP